MAVTEYLRQFPDNGLYKCARCQVRLSDLDFLLCELCSRNGRGYPDISAQAGDYQYIMNGEMHFMNGTACAVSVRHSPFLVYVVRTQAPG